MRRQHIRVLSWGGIGDAVLTTPTFRALKAAARVKLTVVCLSDEHMDVFKHNPHIDRLLPMASLQTVPHKLTNFQRFRFPSYGFLSPSFHAWGRAADLIASLLGAQLEDRRPELFLTEAERQAARQALHSLSNVVALHATPSKPWPSNKAWPIERWERVIRNHPELTFVQLGGAQDVQVTGAVDLRGKVSLRVAFAIVEEARCFMGIDSCLAHAAAAVGTPGVVLFGPSTPAVWGHDSNINLVVPQRCYPCADILKADPCPYGTVCMDALSEAAVSTALRQQLASRQRPS